MIEPRTSLIEASADYRRVERAIHHLECHYPDQPALDELAGAAGLSPAHFQRLFRRWAGVSPKQFLAYVTGTQAGERLRADAPVLEASLDSGMSGPGRLHDLFVALEAVSPGEYKTGGRGVAIAWGVHPSPFGDYLLAVTRRGICALSFLGDGGKADAVAELRASWPGADIRADPAATGRVARDIFGNPAAVAAQPIRLWCRGTNFQIKVWEALLRIPEGDTRTYGDIAAEIGRPAAYRAVGSAVAANPVAVLIPCHRVIRRSGAFAMRYRWGSARKRAILAREAARTQPPSSPRTSNMV